MARDFLFSDDCTLVSHNQADMQTVLNAFSGTFWAFGLNISIIKTELLYQPVPDQHPPMLPSILVDSKQLEIVKFGYLS